MRRHPVRQRIAHDGGMLQDACNPPRNKEIPQILADWTAVATRANRPFSGIRGGMERNLKRLTYGPQPPRLRSQRAA